MTWSVLIIWSVFLAITFGVRPWLSYRQTGDHAYRGFSHGATSLERLSGALFAAAIVALPAAALASLAGAISGLQLPGWVAVLGLALAVAGLVLVLVAQSTMGTSWRVGVDPGERTGLVTGGLFRLVRNPVFSAIGILALGFALVVPNLISLAGVLAGVVAIELQVRRIEEPYLLRAHGDAYTDYARGVGRFVPGIGRLR